MVERLHGTQDQSEQQSGARGENGMRRGGKWQITLRELLLMAVIVALVASVVVTGWRLHEAHQELLLLRAETKVSPRSDAVRAIEELGGTFGYRPTGSPDFLKLASRLGYDERTYWQVFRISLGYNPPASVGDEELASVSSQLPMFTELEVLDLGSGKITNRGVASIPPLPRLTTLRLGGPQITDGLVDVLNRFPALTRLELDSTAVTDAGVAEIRRRFPTCTVER